LKLRKNIEVFENPVIGVTLTQEIYIRWLTAMKKLWELLVCTLFILTLLSGCNKLQNACSPVIIAEDQPPPVEEKALNAYSEFFKGNIALSEDEMKKVDSFDFEDDLLEIFKDCGSFDTLTYALFDVTGDGIPNLLIRENFMVILAYENDSLSVIYSNRFFAGHFYVLTNGATLHYRVGNAPLSLNYHYQTLNNDGTVIESVSFNKNMDGQDSKFIYFEFDGEEISEEEWNQRTQPYLSIDEIEWKDYMILEG